MKNLHNVSIFAGLLALVAATGCSSTQTGSPYHPGPVAGDVVGTGAGVVAGNAVGFAGGVAAGTVSGTQSALDPSYHMVRYWRTETTSDGRTIQVPYDVLVDQYGRPVHMPAPTGNPAPPRVTPTDSTTSTNAVPK